MKSLFIPIHSFVALITNSSTEIYVAVDQSTIDTIKELVNSLLRLGGCATVTCDDLFDISMTEPKTAGQYESFTQNGLVVTPKGGTADHVIAGRILASLDNLFSINAEYNG